MPRRRVLHPGKRGAALSVTEADAIRIMENRVVALDMRRSGASYRQIADQLRCKISTAYGYVQSELLALRQQTEMDAQSVKDLELERCDVMIAGLWPRIKKGDPLAVSTGVRVMERRSKLLGLDAPTKAEFVGALMTVTPEQVSKMSDSEIKDRVTALMNRVALEAAAIQGSIDGEVVEESTE